MHCGQKKAARSKALWVRGRCVVTTLWVEAKQQSILLTKVAANIDLKSRSDVYTSEHTTLVSLVFVDIKSKLGLLLKTLYLATLLCR